MTRSATPHPAAAPHTRLPARHGGRGSLNPAGSAAASSDRRGGPRRSQSPAVLSYHLRGDGAEDVQHGGGEWRLTLLVLLFFFVVVVVFLVLSKALRGGAAAWRVPGLGAVPPAVQQKRKSAADLAGSTPLQLRPVLRQLGGTVPCFSRRLRAAVVPAAAAVPRPGLGLVLRLCLGLLHAAIGLLLHPHRPAPSGAGRCLPGNGGFERRTPD